MESISYAIYMIIATCFVIYIVDVTNRVIFKPNAANIYIKRANWSSLCAITICLFCNIFATLHSLAICELVHTYIASRELSRIFFTIHLITQYQCFHSNFKKFTFPFMYMVGVLLMIYSGIIHLTNIKSTDTASLIYSSIGVGAYCLWNWAVSVLIILVLYRYTHCKNMKYAIILIIFMGSVTSIVGILSVIYGNQSVYIWYITTTESTIISIFLFIGGNHNVKLFQISYCKSICSLCGVNCCQSSRQKSYNEVEASTMSITINETSSHLQRGISYYCIDDSNGSIHYGTPPPKSKCIKKSHGIRNPVIACSSSNENGLYSHLISTARIIAEPSSSSSNENESYSHRISTEPSSSSTNHKQNTETQTTDSLNPQIVLEMQNIVDSVFIDVLQSQQNRMIQCPENIDRKKQTHSRSNKSNQNSNKSTQQNNRTNNNSNINNNGNSMNGNGNGDDGDDEKRNNNKRINTDTDDAEEEEEKKEEEDEDDEKEMEYEEQQNGISTLKANAKSFNPNKSCISTPSLSTISESDQKTSISISISEVQISTFDALSLEPHKLFRARGNIFISRKLTQQTIPSMIKENIPNIYAFMDKMIGFMPLNIDETVTIFDIGDHLELNFDFHAKKTGETLYCVIERQNEFQHKNYKWKMLEQLFTANDIQCKYPEIKLYQLPDSPQSNLTIISSMNHIHKFEDKLKAEALSIVSVTDWRKLDVFSKNSNKKEISLNLTKGEFLVEIKREMININNLHLIPIVLFNDTDILCAFIQIIKINGADIGISYVYIEEMDKIKIIGFHLDKEQILQQHYLVSTQHIDECHCLDNFVSNITAIKIGNLKEKDNQIKGLKNTNIQLKEEKHNLSQENKKLRKDKKSLQNENIDLKKEVEILRAQLAQFMQSGTSPSTSYMVPTDTSNITLSHPSYLSPFPFHQTPINNSNSNEHCGDQTVYTLYSANNQNATFN